MSWTCEIPPLKLQFEVEGLHIGHANGGAAPPVGGVGKPTDWDYTIYFRNSTAVATLMNAAARGTVLSSVLFKRLFGGATQRPQTSGLFGTKLEDALITSFNIAEDGKCSATFNAKNAPNLTHL